MNYNDRRAPTLKAAICSSWGQRSKVKGQGQISIKRNNKRPQSSTSWRIEFVVLPEKQAEPPNLGFYIEVVKFPEIHFKTNDFLAV